MRSDHNPSHSAAVELYDAAGADHEVRRNPTGTELPALGLLAESGDLFVWSPGLTHRQVIAALGHDGLRIWLQPDAVEIDFDAFLIVDTPDEAEELLRASNALAILYPVGFQIIWHVDCGGD